MRRSAAVTAVAVLLAVTLLHVVSAHSPPPRPRFPPGSLTGAAVPLDLASFGVGPVVFLTAHPDDIEGAAGGLVSLLAARGVEIHYVIYTNGDKGCASARLCPPGVTREQISLLRSKEALAAAALFKIPPARVTLLGFEDALLSSLSELNVRQRLVSILRRIKPVAAFLWAPYPNYAMMPSRGWYDLGFHPDHQASARLGIDALFDAGVGLLWPELGPEWSTAQMYLFDFGAGSVAPTHFLDIGGAPRERKLQAYLAHETQSPSKEWAREFLDGVAEMVANSTAVREGAQAAGGKEVNYAEAYLAYF